MASFFAQEEQSFETWFNQMKDQLSEDAAGNLQLEIDKLNALLMETIRPIRTEAGYILSTEAGEYIVVGL